MRSIRKISGVMVFLSFWPGFCSCRVLEPRRSANVPIFLHSSTKPK